MTLQGTMLSRIEGWAKSNGGDAAIHDRKSGWHLGEHDLGRVLASIRRVGKGLMALGLQPEDCVAIVGANRRDWVICQHGINAAQGVSGAALHDAAYQSRWPTSSAMRSRRS